MEEQGIIKRRDVPNWGQTVNSIIFIFTTKISTTVIPYSVNIWLDYGKKLFMRHNVVPYFLLLPQSVAASDPF